MTFHGNPFDKTVAPFLMENVVPCLQLLSTALWAHLNPDLEMYIRKIFPKWKQIARCCLTMNKLIIILDPDLRNVHKENISRMETNSKMLPNNE